MSHPVPASFVLVHGNFLGPWSWERTARVLNGSGARVLAPDLPSSYPGADGAPGDLYADARTVRDALDSLPAPVVLCGHSYGGAVATEAGAEHPSVAGIVYLAGAMPDAGESLASLAPPPSSAPAPDRGESAGAGEQVRTLPDGRIELTPESAAEALFHDCPPTERDRALKLLRPSNPAVGGQPITRAAWRGTPAAYVRCAHDRMPELLSPAFTAMDPPVHTLAAGHCPNLSVPEDVAALLLAQGRQG